MRHQTKENTLTERNSIESIIHKKHNEKNKTQNGEQIYRPFSQHCWDMFPTMIPIFIVYMIFFDDALGRWYHGSVAI